MASVAKGDVRLRKDCLATAAMGSSVYTPAMPDALPWIAAAVVAVAALAAIAQWRGAAHALTRRNHELEDAHAELQDLREAAAKRERRRDDQSNELRDLRKRLDKTKRRAFESQAELEPLQRELNGLRAELAAKTRALAESGDALARAETAVSQAARARDAARAELAEASEIAEGAERETPAPATEPAPGAELETLRKELAAQSRRAAEAEREGARFRQRWRTEQRAYMVIRGELEIAKDRIRALEGRPPREKRHAPPLIPGTPIERGETLAPETEAELSELN